MIKHAVLSAIRRLGYDLVLFNNTESERQHLEIYERVRPYLLSSYERTYALIDATRYIVRKRSSHEDRGFGNPKICRPFLGFIYAAHKCRVFIWCEISVKTRA